MFSLFISNIEHLRINFSTKNVSRFTLVFLPFKNLKKKPNNIKEFLHHVHYYYHQFIKRRNLLFNFYSVMEKRLLHLKLLIHQFIIVVLRYASLQSRDNVRDSL